MVLVDAGLHGRADVVMQGAGDEPDAFAQLDHMRVHPKYLNTNSTSHVWPLGAIAELVDNAQDPDCAASHLWIDVEYDDTAQREPRLVFRDDGSGCSKSTLLSMLSMGYCSKDQTNMGTIGRYGNGFKSGTMRLGNDVVVFTRTEGEASVGLLSQTFLADREANEVLTPIATWSIAPEEQLSPEKHFDETFLRDSGQLTALNLVLQYSPFTNARDMCDYFKRIEKTGTMIVVYTLKRDLQDDTFELDFDETPDDIVLAKKIDEQGRSVRYGRGREVNEHIHNPMAIDYSLRAYLSVLYLQARINIILRGKVVRMKPIALTLKNSWRDTYTPRLTAAKESGRISGGASAPSSFKMMGAGPSSSSAEPETVDIIFGLNADASEPRAYGMMLYHRGRLIKSYQKIGIQAAHTDRRGIHVVGVVSADHLTPTHNKQDFQHDRPFNALMAALSKALLEYYNVKIESSPEWRNYKPAGAVLNWVMCDVCSKWRKLPENVPTPDHNQFWECSYNRDYRNFTSTCYLPDDKIAPIESRRSAANLKRKLLRDQQLAAAAARATAVPRPLANNTVEGSPLKRLKLGNIPEQQNTVAVGAQRQPEPGAVGAQRQPEPGAVGAQWQPEPGAVGAQRQPELGAAEGNGLADVKHAGVPLRPNTEALKAELRNVLADPVPVSTVEASTHSRLWNDQCERRVEKVDLEEEMNESENEATDDIDFDMTVPSRPPRQALTGKSPRPVEDVLEALFWKLYQQFLHPEEETKVSANELRGLDVEQLVTVVTKNIEHQVEARFKRVAEQRALMAVAKEQMSQQRELKRYIEIIRTKNENWKTLKEYCAALQKALVSFTGRSPEELMSSPVLSRFRNSVIEE
ncbi:MORC family CW-type zinc finger protein 3 [Porphyridium purpureum]|uniref:MORC family CW-type zinc finger protein 3 n=1 Tax=Porphyridium purpureum TaxID=35688 RepID=A0A5J4YSE7_PORPP|nr:MORC family CW-type zinc finger protein 3 [Porphyridium purpureum]|eukprot:POR2282..scf229_5